MAKGSGGTKTGSASNPSGIVVKEKVQDSSITTIENITKKTTIVDSRNKYEKLLSEIRGGKDINYGFYPLLKKQAKAMESLNNKKISKDSLTFRMGPHGFDGDTFKKVLKEKDFAGIKISKMKVPDNWQANGESTIYLIKGYKDFEQIRRLSVRVSDYQDLKQHSMANWEKWYYGAK